MVRGPKPAQPASASASATGPMTASTTRWHDAVAPGGVARERGTMCMVDERLITAEPSPVLFCATCGRPLLGDPDDEDER